MSTAETKTQEVNPQGSRANSQSAIANSQAAAPKPGRMHVGHLRSEQQRRAIKLPDGRRLMVRHIVLYNPDASDQIRFVMTNGHEERAHFLGEGGKQASQVRDLAVEALDREFGT